MHSFSLISWSLYPKQSKIPQEYLNINPIKPRFICAASSSSLTDVSKWLCSFFKAMFPTVNDLWVSKLKKADVPCDSSWILNDSTGVVEVLNNLNRSRSASD
jgi:hypothetical protein